MDSHPPVKELQRANYNLQNQLNDLKGQVSAMKQLLNQITTPDGGFAADMIEKELLKREMIMQAQMMLAYRSGMEQVKDSIKGHQSKLETDKKQLQSFYQDKIEKEKAVNRSLTNENIQLRKKLSQCLDIMSDMAEDSGMHEAEAMLTQLEMENESLREMMHHQV